MVLETGSRQKIEASRDRARVNAKVRKWALEVVMGSKKAAHAFLKGLETANTPALLGMSRTPQSFHKHRLHMCLWLEHELQRHLCACLKESVIWSAMSSLLLVSSSHFSLPVYHNTWQHLDSTTFSKTTLYTEHLFQNLCGRQATPKNRFRTSITESGGNPRNTSSTDDEPKELATKKSRSSPWRSEGENKSDK